MGTGKDTIGMPGMEKEKTPPPFSFQRSGYGLEMIGALGNTDQFGFDWQRQQHYVGPFAKHRPEPKSHRCSSEQS